MIPQCDSAVLDANPRFESLHAHLVGTLLRSDAATREKADGDDESKRRREVEDELRELQVGEMRKKILTRAITKLAYEDEESNGGLSAELRDSILTIALFLEHTDSPGNQVEDEILSLLGPDTDMFLSHIPSLAPAVTEFLASEMTHLKSLTNTSIQVEKEKDRSASNAQRERSLRPGARHRDITSTSSTTTTDHNTTIPSLSAHLSSRLQELQHSQLTVAPEAQRQVAETAACVLAAHTCVTERIIHILERTKYGAVARAEKAQAEHLARSAEAVNAKAKIMRRDIMDAIYNPKTSAALVRYRDHLRDTRFRLEEKQQNAQREIAAYENTDTQSGMAGTRAVRDDVEKNGGTQMTEIARKYGALTKDVEAIRLEIETLENS